MRFSVIGYWRSDREPEWPDPADFVDLEWDSDERRMVAEYLRNGLIARACMGLSPRRTCGKPNGSLELTDGELLWPEGLVHFVEDHNVRLPRGIVERMIARLDDFDEADLDLAPWTPAVGSRDTN